MKLCQAICSTIPFLLCFQHAHSCDVPYEARWDKVIIEILKYNPTDSSYRNFATAFLVYDYDTSSAAILITNRHVVQDTDLLWLRINLKDSSPRSVDTVSVQKRCSTGWNVVVPDDTTLDLGAIKMTSVDKHWDIIGQSKSRFLPSPQISRGTTIFFLGFPLGITLPERSTPIYRSGAVALDKDYYRGLYLLDALVLPGNSGSPVFDCQGRLLGVLTGHTSYYTKDEDNVWEIIGPSVLISASLRLNSGFGSMIPIDDLLSFLAEISPGWSKLR